MKKLIACFAAVAIALSLINTSIALATETATSAQRTHNPSAENMAIDAALGRPTAAVVTTLGLAGYILTLPFSAAGGNTKQVGEAFVAKPAHNLFGRCLGCEPVSPADLFFGDYDDDYDDK